MSEAADDLYLMRAPCKACGYEKGVIRTVSGQDTVRCAPKTETGRAVPWRGMMWSIWPAVAFSAGGEAERHGLLDVEVGPGGEGSELDVWGSPPIMAQQASER